MSLNGWTAVIGSNAPSLVANTAKSVLSIIPASSRQLVIVEFSISFDSVTSTDKPVLLELCTSTQGATGTSTSVTITQVRGIPSASAPFTAQCAYSGEPTTLTPIKEWRPHPQRGDFTIQFPLGRETVGLWDTTNVKALVLRCTSAQTPTVRGYAEVEAA